ncbi:MAG TPA: ABC transporter ATP-binding protein [Burkholderiales bacterium]|nr:ABC transporter ATP-binding protein [Burkholderiales bacterium]
MLSVESLAFGYPQRTVGRDVSFTLNAGEVMCILGPNGSGKTTLLRTLLGLLSLQEGQIRVEEKPLSSLSRVEIARFAGYVPQAHQPYFAYSVRDMVLMGRSSHLGTFSVPGAHDREVAARVLESLGISQLAERPVTEISAGERQLALIARALAQEPRLLVMDEPTASLDFGNQVRVLERLSALAAGGISILFSTHDPDQAFLAAQRALLLADGQVLAIGAPRDVIRADTLERLYHVAVQVVPLEGGGHTCLPALRR